MSFVLFVHLFVFSTNWVQCYLYAHRYGVDHLGIGNLPVATPPFHPGFICCKSCGGKQNCSGIICTSGMSCPESTILPYPHHLTILHYFFPPVLKCSLGAGDGETDWFIFTNNGWAIRAIYLQQFEGILLNILQWEAFLT